MQNLTFVTFFPSLLGYPLKQEKRAFCFFLFTIICVTLLSLGAAPLSHPKYLSRHQISLRLHSTPNPLLWLWPKDFDIQVTIVAWPFNWETASPASNGIKGVHGVLLKSISARESNPHILWGAGFWENRDIKKSNEKKCWQDDSRWKCVVFWGYEEETAKSSGILDCGIFHASVHQSAQPWSRTSLRTGKPYYFF